MDIRMIGSCCAKITLSGEECSDLGISYSGFSPDSLTARFFLASVLARLGSMGADINTNEKLTAEIFENEDGGLIIYISGKGIITQTDQETESVRLLNTPEEVIEAAKLLDDEKNAMLYRYRNVYAIIDDNDESILCAKIKEHGKLLSDAPKQALSVL